MGSVEDGERHSLVALYGMLMKPQHHGHAFCDIEHYILSCQPKISRLPLI
jgi:hypothetical protein